MIHRIFENMSLWGIPENGEPLSNFSFQWQGSGAENGHYLQDLSTIAGEHFRKISENISNAWEKNFREWGEVASLVPDAACGSEGMEYGVDLAQRCILFLEALHQRSNDFLEHEEGKGRTVLAWEHELIVDGEQLQRPVNYSLVRIVPPRGAPFREEARPYIIIDPRAGHGSGIGGFKHESEVGCAIHAGHPVYFVIFSRLPKEGQTLSDVCAAEAEFVREVMRRHSKSPKPIVIGNCQGGWAAMLLAATNPDITGPVVANGAPLSYWAGVKGKNPMRYLGGVYGGVSPVMFLSDLGNGHFDGANLVFNFERFNPARTWWQKYYDVFANVEKETQRFLEFERWWGSFYLMSEAEITWIIENLFVGNKLARGKANLDERNHLDLRDIQSPIIVFGSHGDNITPPQQALGWIADNYKNVEEIKVRGQRILYMLHDSVGHLGIFVSSKVAQKQHKEIVSTLEAIEALAPGLYEMVIDEETGEGIDKHFSVTFEERGIEEMMSQAGGVDDDRPFATAARFSDIGAELYDLSVRPAVKSVVSKPFADALTATHPLRLPRYLMSHLNPLLSGLPVVAEKVRQERRPVAPSNPFVRWERTWADTITQWWDGVRDVQDFCIEMSFHWLYGSPGMKAFGERLARRISDAPQEDLRSLVSVQDALDRMDQGGMAEGVVRMLIFLAQSRQEVRRSRLERSNEVLMTMEPFASMKPKHRSRIIHRESLNVGFEPQAAMECLPKLLKTREEREKALEICWQIAGPKEEMAQATIDMMETFARVLETQSKEEGSGKQATESKSKTKSKAKTKSEPEAGSDNPGDSTAPAVENG